MIKASHHWFYTRFFNWYFPTIMKRDFQSIELDGEWKPAEKASLIIGNHVSWWDGFWVYYLNLLILKKKYHGMMLEKQLATRLFLSKMGVYSIHPGSRKVLESLNYTVELLSINNNMVVIYPQGELVSMSQTEIHFERGVERILEKCQPVQLLFYAAFVDYFSERKPTLFLYLKEEKFNRYSASELNRLYQQFYNESRMKQLDKAK